MNSTLQTDPEYLHAGINDKKFQRNTDSLYVGTTKGIMYAYNYDILDTITPNNTSNMPSSNVLEIEFDHLDQLWAVFGDAADVPFAIAKLEANNWTNRIDASNAPINFSEFLGLEIDTLGNLWVADNLYIHTLLTANSPGWLGITSNIPLEEIDIIPNPSDGLFEISSMSDEKITVDVFDEQGKLTLSSELPNPSDKSTFDLRNQPPGVYFAHISQGEQQWVRKLVVR
jgi:ligand-binding sensor domain-containing protein